MRVNTFVTPQTKGVLTEWSVKYNTTIDVIVNALIEFAFTNGYTDPPIRVTSASDILNDTVHITVEIWNEDYIAITETRGKKAIKLSRILEYLIHHEVFDPTYLDYMELAPSKVSKKIVPKMTFNKFLLEEQTKLAMTPDANIAVAKDAIYDNFDTVWPILKFANSRLQLQSELVSYIDKILNLRGKKE